MDREGAETYLRLLAEAAMRGSLAPAVEPGPPGASRMMVVGHALTAVGALDPVVTEEILTDFRLAVSVRHLHSDPGQGPGQAVTVAQWFSQGRAVLHRKPHQAPSPATAPAEAVSVEAVSVEAVSVEAVSVEAVSVEAVSVEAVSVEAGPPGDDAGQDRADRFVPVGLTVPFRAGAVSGPYIPQPRPSVETCLGTNQRCTQRV